MLTRTTADVDPKRAAPAARQPPPVLLLPGALHRPSGAGLPAPRPDAVAGEATDVPDPRPARPPGTGGREFGRQVERYRRHLAPIRVPALLEASFGREAFQLAGTRPRPRTRNPLRVAYAIRWIELTTGVGLPPWDEWADAPEPDEGVEP